MEADQMHADIIVEDLNLKGANEAKTPCEEERRWQDEENRVMLGEKRHEGIASWPLGPITWHKAGSTSSLPSKRSAEVCTLRLKEISKSYGACGNTC